MNIRRIALGLIVSAICLYFVLRGVDWGEVLNHLSQVNLPLFLLSMLLMLVAYFLMAWRWQLLLAPLELPVPSSYTFLNSMSTTEGVDRGIPLSGGFGGVPQCFQKRAPLPRRGERGWGEGSLPSSLLGRASCPRRPLLAL